MASMIRRGRIGLEGVAWVATWGAAGSDADLGSSSGSRDSTIGRAAVGAVDVMGSGAGALAAIALAVDTGASAAGALIGSRCATTGDKEPEDVVCRRGALPST